MMTKTHETDVAIIGAGPCGLFAVFECGMLGLSTHVIDSLEDIGGQCGALYPEKPIYDIPGFPSVAAGDLIEHLEAQANPFHPIYTLGEGVTDLKKDGEGWQLSGAKGTHIKAKAVIIAAGAGAFGPNRPPLERLEEFEGRSVFYMVRKRKDFAGKRVVIAGGGDSAVDWTLSLAEIADRVTLVHRRDKFRAAPENVARVHQMAQNGQIDFAVPYQLAGLEGEGGQISAVRLKTLEEEERVIEADALLPFYGLAPDLGPIAGWGLTVEHHHIPVEPGTCETNLSGVYAIGDIASYPHKIKLILTGFADAAHAAHAAYRKIHPETELHFEYSTTKGLPGAA